MSSEKSLRKTYQVSTIDNEIRRGRIRADHNLQRLSGQWNNTVRDNLIACIVRGDPVPAVILAEQAVQGVNVNWLLDGKQRMSNAVNYRRGVFKLGKNIERPVVSYVEASVDENGEHVYQTKEFDLRGKAYSDLPEELKDAYDGYEFDATLYLDCSDDDIEFHIRRYNTGKPMTAAQKGITYLGNEYARVAKKLCYHDFFRNKVGKYGDADMKNGSVERIITESVMGISFLPNWKKKNEEICDYLKDHATVSAFDIFEGYLDRLTALLGKGAKEELFNSRDSFLFFILFDRFSKLGLEDDKFADFLLTFKEELHSKMVGDVSYDILTQKATKDKAVVLAKVDLLEKLLYYFFDIEKEPVKDIIVNDRNMLNLIASVMDHDFVQNIGLTEGQAVNVTANYFRMSAGACNQDVQSFISSFELKEDDKNDLLLYLDILGDWCAVLNNNSSLLGEEYLPVVLNFVSYTVKNDVDDVAQEWFVDFFENFDNENCFTSDPVANLTLMRDKFTGYVEYQEKKGE